MLCITMRKGDYFKIGENITVRFDHLNSERVHLSIDAPKEVPILRGEVLERNGGQRPECVYNGHRYHKKELIWNRSKAQALAAMRRLLEEMDGANSDVQALRRQLNHMFPPGDGGAGDSPQTTQFSNG